MQSNGGRACGDDGGIGGRLRFRRRCAGVPGRRGQRGCAGGEDLYGLGTVLLTAAVTAVYTFPGIAAFDAPVGRQLLNSLFFAGKSPVTVLPVVGAWLLPFYITYSFMEWMPLWAFLWCCFGFAAAANVQAHFLLRLYAPYLAAAGGAETDKTESRQLLAGAQRTQRQILKDMKRLGM